MLCSLRVLEECGLAVPSNVSFPSCSVLCYLINGSTHWLWTQTKGLCPGLISFLLTEISLQPLDFSVLCGGKDDCGFHPVGLMWEYLLASRPPCDRFITTVALALGKVEGGWMPNASWRPSEEADPSRCDLYSLSWRGSRLVQPSA